MKTFTKLVLSGGSVKGFSTLGAVQYFLDKSLLDIDTYVGCSCGAITGYLLAIGYSPVEIMSYVCTNNFMDKIISEFDINSMLSGKGLTEFNLQQLLEKMTIDKIGHFITLGELKEKYSKNLICSVFNITKEKSEYFGPDTHATMPCITAVKISCNLPLIFEKYKYMDSYYIDGGISDNFPIEVVDNGKDNVLGLNLSSEKDTKQNEEEFNFVNYFFNLLFIPVKQISLNKIKNSSENCATFTINVDIESKLKFDLSKTEILELFSAGYQQVKEEVEKND